MSLNGLDSQDVTDAYSLTANEPGGWFLLRYASRDQVELLSCGRNGVTEARIAIQGHSDASPLYGLLIYRRRRVLIKYIPEGTSRLLQARTAVHFSDVQERYSPYETILEISSSEALNDTSLAASFPLHTAASSLASNRLHEISEDGEDAGPSVGGSVARRAASTHSFASSRYKSDRRGDQMGRSASADRHTPSIQVTSDQPPASPRAPPSKASISQFLVRDDSGHTSVTPLESSLPVSSASQYGAPSGPSRDEGMSAVVTEPPMFPQMVEGRDEPTGADTPPAVPPKSSERLRRMDNEASNISDQGNHNSKPSLSGSEKTVTGAESKKVDENDPYDLAKYDEWFKPKVKLGPRPVAATDRTKRSTTANIAGLPANLRAHARKPEPSPSPSHPTIRGSSSAALLSPSATAGFAPPPIPNSPEYIPRPVSRGSIKSLPSHRSTATTSDKLRLMKAVELRKKQMRKSNTHDQALVPPKIEEIPVPKVPENLEKPPQGEEKKRLEPQVQAEQSDQTESNKADSGIELHYDKPTSDASEQSKKAESSGAALADAPKEIEETAVETTAPNPQEPLQSTKSSTADEATAETVDLDETPKAEKALEDVNAAPLVSEAPSAGTIAPPAETVPEEEKPVAEDAVDHEKSVQSKPVEEDSALHPSVPEEEKPMPTIVTEDHSRPASVEDAKALLESHDSEPAPSLPSVDDDHDSDLQEMSVSPKQGNSNLAKRRRGFVEPLHVEVNSGNPDDFISDDEFLEELQSATLQEATPVTAVSVARTPGSPFFPDRRPSAQSVQSDKARSVQSINISRQPSIPIDNFYPDTSGGLSPDAWRAPTPSSYAGTTPPAEKADTGSGLARNVSSGISKRIQALAEVSNRESGVYSHGSPSQQFQSESSPNSFLQQDHRDRFVKNSQRGRPTSFRKRSSNRLSGLAANDAPAMPETNTVFNVRHDPMTNRNSVSVSARIVRPAAPVETEGDASQLQKSEVMINHHRGSATSSKIDLPTPATYVPTRSSDNTSPELVREPSDPRALRSAGRFSRQKMQMPTSPSPDDFPPPPSNRALASRVSLTSSDENGAPKESSRTSRFFKRMSNFGGGVGGKRKSGATPQQQASAGARNANVESASTRSVQRASIPETPPAAVVGDLNVQFPDSLLWKRRIVSIDDAGYLQFAVSQGTDVQKGMRRFHFSQFKQPYVPDLDSQELANSVVLELGDGTMLQAACEDAMTHRQVVHVFKSYWKAWTAPGVPPAR